MALPDIKEAEYVDKVAAERAGEALDQATAAGQMQDAETAAPVAEALAPPEQPAQPEPAPGRVQPTNLVQLVPKDLLFRDNVKNPARVDQDVRMLYDVLADSPFASALIKSIRDRLRGNYGS